jgi:hypothetical protein
VEAACFRDVPGRPTVLPPDALVRGFASFLPIAKFVSRWQGSWVLMELSEQLLST